MSLKHTNTMSFNHTRGVYLFFCNACGNRHPQRLQPPAVNCPDREGLLPHAGCVQVLIREKGLCFAYLVFCCLLKPRPFSRLCFSSPVEQLCVKHYWQLQELSEKTISNPISAASCLKLSFSFLLRIMLGCNFHTQAVLCLDTRGSIGTTSGALKESTHASRAPALKKNKIK